MSLDLITLNILANMGNIELIFFSYRTHNGIISLNKRRSLNSSLVISCFEVFISPLTRIAFSFSYKVFIKMCKTSLWSTIGPNNLQKCLLRLLHAMVSTNIKSYGNAINSN